MNKVVVQFSFKIELNANLFKNIFILYFIHLCHNFDLGKQHYTIIYLKQM